MNKGVRPVLRTLYFDLFTSTSVLRPFVKFALLIGREVQAEVKFRSKYRKGRTDIFIISNLELFKSCTYSSISSM